MTNNKRHAQPRERLYLPTHELRVQRAADGSNTIAGYAAVFGQRSEDLGNFVEEIASGCFSDTLLNKGDVLCLRDHDPKILLGGTKAGTLSLSEDSKGLRFVCVLPKTTQADDLAESIRRGDLDGVSFGFRKIDDRWTKDENGQLVRTLLKVDLFEISPCSFPAYSSANVSLRSCPPELRMYAKVRSELSTEDECDRDCPECQDGDCANCTDLDSGHSRATTRAIAMVTDTEVHRMHMRLNLAQRR